MATGASRPAGSNARATGGLRVVALPVGKRVRCAGNWRVARPVDFGGEEGLVFGMIHALGLRITSIGSDDEPVASGHVGWDSHHERAWGGPSRSGVVCCASSRVDAIGNVHRGSRDLRHGHRVRVTAEEQPTGPDVLMSGTSASGRDLAADWPVSAPGRTLCVRGLACVWLLQSASPSGARRSGGIDGHASLVRPVVAHGGAQSIAFASPWTEWSYPAP